MRYDDFDDYNSRSSRSSSRGSSRSGRDREYDRSYSDRGGYSDDYYDRGYSSRGYNDRSDRGYSDRSYSDRSRSSRDRYDDFDRYSGGSSRSGDRYGSSSSRSSRSRYDDFDPYGWERTAPNWDDRGRKPSKSSRDYDDYDRRSSSRGRSSGSSRGGSGSRSSGSGRSSGGGRSDSRRSSSSQRRPAKRGGSVPLVPIALGLVVIILAALIIKSFVGGGSEYDITFGSTTIVVGETTTASIVGLSENDNHEIEWTSKDSSVVSVEGDGASCTLTAKSVGSTVVGAIIDGEKSVNGTVIVTDVAPGVVRIDMAQETVQIYSEDTYTAQATVVMESAEMTPAKITWSSNDSSVARVDEHGVITGRDAGMAIIKATAGEKTAEIAVTVVANPENERHDASQNTGNEPEEGAEPPPDDGSQPADTPQGSAEEDSQSGEANGTDSEASDGTPSEMNE